MLRHARDDYDTHGVNDNSINSRKYCGGYPIGSRSPTVTQTDYGMQAGCSEPIGLVWAPDL